MAAEARSAMDALNAKFMKNFEAGNCKGVADLFSPDCTFMPPNMETKSGRKAVEEVLNGLKAKGVAKINLKTEQMYGDGEYFYEIGSYTTTMDGGDFGWAGKSVIVLKKIKGVFYIHTDIFNKNA